MEQEKSLFFIYTYEFHKAPEQSLLAESSGIDADKYLKIAPQCFSSLFDLRTIEPLVKLDSKGQATRLHNDVMSNSFDIINWRVNNEKNTSWVALTGKDSRGIPTYDTREEKSYPHSRILIDLRPDHSLIAIEKSKAWSTDTLRDMLLKNLNRELADKFGLEMSIEARMNPTDIWEFVHQRIYEHGDQVSQVAFRFTNLKRRNPKNKIEVKSARLKSMIRIAEVQNALKARLILDFDKDSKEFAQTNKDVAEMVELCGRYGYEIIISFKDFKTYRINDYVRAYFPLEAAVLKRMEDDAVQLTIDGKTELEEWFDTVEEQTRGCVNESKVPKRRNKRRK